MARTLLYIRGQKTAPFRTQMNNGRSVFRSKKPWALGRGASLLVTIWVSAFGPVALSYAGPKSADERDIVVDNAIGGMREGSRIISADEYGKKTKVPATPGTRLSPTDTGVTVAAAGGAAAQGAAGAGGIDTGGGGGLGGSTTPIEEQPTGGIEGPGGTGGGGTEPESVTGTTPETGGSLIDIDANVGLEDGGAQTDVNVGLDTEQREQILDADVGAGAADITEVSGSTDITAGEITGDSELPVETSESAISSDTDIGTEVDTSGSSVGNEADIGVEADIEGGGEGDDLADDPADGLPVL